MTKYYRALPRSDYSRRLLIIKMLGEMRRTEALPFLLSVVREQSKDPLQGAPGRFNSVREALIQSGAVRSIAYLRTPDALKRPFASQESIHLAPSGSRQ